MLRAEAAHQQGRLGVLAVKAWLESTTHITLSFDAYDFTTPCSVQVQNGAWQTFDLAGKFLTRPAPLYVEVKTYTTVGGQVEAFAEFLVTAYSATAKNFETLGDPKYEFMWVTTHPFSQNKWPQLTTRATIAEAVRADATGLLNGEEVDDNILDLMASRIWLLVLHERQHELVLTRSELSQVQAILDREKAGA